jgi:hypothetical protein
MSVFRSYFEKNNTIISDSNTNTAKNQVSELFYGGKHSRLILKIDLSNLIDRINQGYINRDTISKHILKLTNTVNPSPDATHYFNEITGIQTKRAVSFDLVLFKIEEEWDEGTGYDYADTTLQQPLENTYDERPSNWTYRNTVSTWLVNGAMDNGSVIATQHFDNGNENIEFDVTQYINDVLDGNEIHYGLGIAFDAPYEAMNTLDIYRSVAFFSKYTQTFFEPFLETVYDDSFVDNRNDFYFDSERCLILYVNQSGQPVDLDALPTVDIMNGGSTLLSDLSASKVSKGVYKVCFTISKQQCASPIMLTDVWKGLSIDGYSIGNQEQHFVLKDNMEFLTFGSESEPTPIKFSFHGISKDEKILSGDIKKIYVEARSPYTFEDKILIDNIEYRVYVTEGRKEIDVIEWSKVTKAINANYFLLDTSMLISNKEYFIDIKMTSNREVITHTKQISFYVTNRG